MRRQKTFRRGPNFCAKSDTSRKEGGKSFQHYFLSHKCRRARMKAEEGAPKRANSQQKTSCNVYLLRSSFGNFCNGQNWASSRKNCARRRERDGVFRHGMTARYYGRGGYVSVTALRRYDRLSEKNSQGNPLLPLRSLLFLPRSGPPSLPRHPPDVCKAEA